MDSSMPSTVQCYARAALGRRTVAVILEARLLTDQLMVLGMAAPRTARQMEAAIPGAAAGAVVVTDQPCSARNLRRLGFVFKPNVYRAIVGLRP